jgi:hypothetical protein
LAGASEVSNAWRSHHASEFDRHAGSAQTIREPRRDFGTGFAGVHADQNRHVSPFLSMQIVAQRDPKRFYRSWIKRRIARDPSDPIRPK